MTCAAKPTCCTSRDRFTDRVHPGQVGGRLVLPRFDRHRSGHDSVCGRRAALTVTECGRRDLGPSPADSRRLDGFGGAHDRFGDELFIANQRESLCFVRMVRDLGDGFRFLPVPDLDGRQ